MKHKFLKIILNEHSTAMCNIEHIIGIDYFNDQSLSFEKVKLTILSSNKQDFGIYAGENPEIAKRFMHEFEEFLYNESPLMTFDFTIKESKNSDYIIINYNTKPHRIECQICGKFEQIKSTISVDDFARKMNEFFELHKKCRKE